MRLKGWAGARPQEAESTRLKSVSVERRWEWKTEAEPSREVPSVIQSRADQDMLRGTI